MLTDGQRAYLTLMLRRVNDPCWKMELTPTQAEANRCKARYIAIRGANRSGKTAFSAKKLATVARRLPDVKTTQVTGVYIVFAPSRSQLADPWGKKLLKGSEVKGALFNKPFIPEHEIKAVRYTYGAGEPTINLIELHNGNYILFCVSGDKNVWKRVEGKGHILGVVLDESAGTEMLLEEVMTRLLDANSNEQVRREAGGAWLLWGATQTKKSPAFERFLALCRSGSDPHFAAFDLLPGENPAIDQAEREAMQSIMSKESYEIRMLGHGSAAGSMALYPQWDDERNLVPVGGDYAPGPTDNLWVFFDPGSHYTGIVIAAINKQSPRTIRVVRCIQNSRTTIEHDVKCVRDWLQGRKLEGWIYDQAARKMEKVGNSVIGRLEEVTKRRGYDIAIHRSFMMGRSRYEDTVPILRDYLAPRPDDVDYPARIILNRDANSGCGLLRWQVINCAFTENAYELKEDNIQKGQDHCSDALRYGCSRMPAWVDRGMNPKLWGEGTAGQDPDEGVEYDPSVNGDTKTPGQEFARKRIRRRQERVRANQFNAF